MTQNSHFLAVAISLGNDAFDHGVYVELADLLKGEVKEFDLVSRVGLTLLGGVCGFTRISACVPNKHVKTLVEQMES